MKWVRGRDYTASSDVKKATLHMGMKKKRIYFPILACCLNIGNQEVFAGWITQYKRLKNRLEQDSRHL